MAKAGLATHLTPADGKRWRVGEPLPAVLYIDDLAVVLGLHKTVMYDMQASGELDSFEMKPRVGKRARYSGKKVQQWLDGDGAVPRLFARGKLTAK